MFNAPRPAQRYASTPGNGLAGSYVDQNPLSSSAYDGLDPWSAAPTPSPPPVAAPSVFSSVIGMYITEFWFYRDIELHSGDAVVPSIYHRSFQAVDSTDTGETSVNALLRVLATSSLPASTIDRVSHLVSLALLWIRALCRL